MEYNAIISNNGCLTDTAGLAEALAIELAPGELTDAERALAAELVREKYAHPTWTLRA